MPWLSSRFWTTDSWDVALSEDISIAEWNDGHPVPESNLADELCPGVK